MTSTKASKGAGPHTKASAVLLPGRDPKELRLTFAGNVVKHLGVQMYAGRPAPAIAELISNAWDADATRVDVRVPLDEPWDSSNAGHLIEVSDDGHGMDWEMVRKAYLDVGRDKRAAQDDDRSPKGRLLQGRKGVGKLAGFGIADVVEVQTVFEQKDPVLRQRVLIWFRLSWAKIKRASGSVPVEMVFAGPIDKAPEGGRTKKGTTVRLKRLHHRRAQNADRFHHAMAQRFVFQANFRVRINGEDLRSEDITLQWRFPPRAGKWLDGQVPGVGPVKYWIGFTEQPRKQQDGELSGILIYTRGKVAQEAMHFDLSGGMTGQHGLRYLVGMVKAEWLDAGVHEPDLIATHRGTIAWESPQGEEFSKWGKELVRKHLAIWSKRRAKLREQQVKEVSPEIRSRIERLAPAYREVALGFVDKFQSLEIEPDEFASIFGWFLDALENATLRRILDKLRETPVADLKELDDLLGKMEVRTAVALLQIVESNLAAIATLEKMHLTDAKERGVLAKHLERNPWLIDPTWMLNRAEAGIALWIEKEFKLKRKGTSDDKKRVDFFCVGVGGVVHVVEIKRGAHVATHKDLHQATKYRDYLLKRFKELTDPKTSKYGIVQSHLIAASLAADAVSTAEALAANGSVLFVSWGELVDRAKVAHHQFRTALERRAKDDEST